MTSKEALEILVKQANERKLSNKIVANGIAVSFLEKLVERDTPMKVKHENNGIPYCAVCERSYLRDGRGNQNRFCGYCGQRLDWSENK